MKKIEDLKDDDIIYISLYHQVPFAATVTDVTENWDSNNFIFTIKDKLHEEINDMMFSVPKDWTVIPESFTNTSIELSIGLNKESFINWLIEQNESDISFAHDNIKQLKYENFKTN